MKKQTNIPPTAAAASNDRNSNQTEGTRRLAHLCDFASHFAQRSLSACGRLLVACLMPTSEGVIIVQLKDGDGPEQRQTFIHKCRLMASAYNVRQAVILAQPWIAEGTADVSVRQSDSPDGQECVVIYGEGVCGIKQTSIYSVLRDAAGRFSSLKFDRHCCDGVGVASHFAGIMPPKPLGKMARKIARRALAATNTHVTTYDFSNSRRD